MTEPLTKDRRRFFNQFLNIDKNVPNKAPWHRVPEVGAGDGDVLWSGWAGNGELFVVGDEGMVLHYTGTADQAGDLWQQMTLPVRQPLHGIWGASANNLYAVGWMGTLLHYDGQQWHHLSGGKIDEKTGKFQACQENTPLFAIDGSAKGEAWAVGDDGVILHFDGKKWQLEQSPTSINLRAVACAEDQTVYAIGGEGTVLQRNTNGQWLQLECQLSSGFQAMLIMPDGSLLLGGGRYFIDQGGFRGELVHYKDGEFHALDFEQSMPRIRALKSYKDGVLIVGDQGHLYYLNGLRLDKLESNSHHDLMDIIVLPTGEAIVVGDFGTIMTAAEDFTKALAPPPKAVEVSPWQAMETQNTRQLWQVSEGVNGNCYACGEAGTVLRLTDLTNDCWETLPPPSDLAVHCVWDSGNGLFAAGQLGRIYRFGGQEWTLHFDLHLDITILAMWGSSPNSIYAVGDEGLILHFDGLNWQRMASGTKSALYGLWAWDNEHLLAPGDFGLILRYNGTEWAEFNVGTENFLYGAWGDSLTNIYSVGLSGTLAHFNGQRWQQMATRLREDLLSISGSEKAGAYAVGTRGCVLRLDHGQWLREESGSSAGLRSVCATQSGVVYAVGDKGTILQRK
ncbi:WD40/YVTN/BNR-like repeat-containing protein [Colwellia ponticola]|uniref:Glycosyl hydrolase n=1 Tax=Colwellia ponticola TaxID=2304625 RepID=A0A8H2JP63_9GAMM|nr:glycosyl hydrolase [Colwellia ponticola]TMM47787.1 glycosyl hydrolase [Colwellia ponticola]